MSLQDTKIIALSEVSLEDARDMYEFMLIENEQVYLSYKGMRDRAIFTNFRLIIINVQGLTGKKKKYYSIPYSKFNGNSVETAGTFDIDTEFEFWVSGMGGIKLEFTRNTDVKKIAVFLSSIIH